MAATDGHIELERSVASLQVGVRHRRDLGDIDALAASIERVGLLQPITITPDGVLVCGARRLAAIRQLGWDTVKVWVRSGISGKLAHLLAEQDDNVLHKPLTQLEQAALYRELKVLLAEDAAAREQATQFSSQHQPRWNGSAESADPLTPTGDSRQQAAEMVTGASSYTRLEEVSYLQRTADNPALPEAIHRQAQGELDRIEHGAPVHPAWQRIRDLVTSESARRSQDAGQLAEEALARLKAQPKKKTKHRTGPPTPSDGGTAELWPTRAFVQTWRGFDDWWDHFDPTVLADKLTSDEVEEFFTAVEAAVRFAEKIRAALTPPSGGQHPKLRAV